MKLGIVYHCLLYKDTPENFLDNAFEIVANQMAEAEASGLLPSVSDFVAGINGGKESLDMARLVLPAKARITLHGLQCHNENRTILMLEQWAKEHPDWYVLYFHSKGATHAPTHTMSATWRKCMMRTAVLNWRQCVRDLDSGYEAVGVHWMEPPATPPGHHIFAGNFFWAKASFLRSLPSIMDRARIAQSGLDSLESRYESEVWIGNGTRPPRVKDYHPYWNPSKIGTCK